MKKPIFVAMLAGLVFFGTGCRHGLTTALVWQIDEYHPARIPRLQLSTIPGTNDVLVQYDECFGQSKAIRPRAYWLIAYAAHDTNSGLRPKPEFIADVESTNAYFIPHAKICQTVATNGFCARLSPTERSFKLWRNGAELGEYNLPVYSNAPPVTWGRVLLTPLTVTTDAAIVTAAVSVWILVLCPPIFGAGGG